MLAALASIAALALMSLAPSARAQSFATSQSTSTVCPGVIFDGAPVIVRDDRPANFSVSLAAPPSGPITFQLDSARYNFTACTVTFSPDRWQNIPVRIYPKDGNFFIPLPAFDKVTLTSTAFFPSCIHSIPVGREYAAKRAVCTGTGPTAVTTFAGAQFRTFNDERSYRLGTHSAFRSADVDVQVTTATHFKGAYYQNIAVLYGREYFILDPVNSGAGQLDTVPTDGSVLRSGGNSWAPTNMLMVWYPANKTYVVQLRNGIEVTIKLYRTEGFPIQLDYTIAVPTVGPVASKNGGMCGSVSDAPGTITSAALTTQPIPPTRGWWPFWTVISQTFDQSIVQPPASLTVQRNAGSRAADLALGEFAAVSTICSISR